MDISIKGADPTRDATAQVPLLWLLVQDRQPVRTGSWVLAFLIPAIISVRLLTFALNINFGL